MILRRPGKSTIKGQETTRLLDGQDIHSLLWTLKDHYRFQEINYISNQLSPFTASCPISSGPILILVSHLGLGLSSSLLKYRGNGVVFSPLYFLRKVLRPKADGTFSGTQLHSFLLHNDILQTSNVLLSRMDYTE
jgi:hypothetical protein